MLRHRLIWIVLALTMLVEALPQAPLVHWVGELHKVMGGQDEGIFELATLQEQTHLYALGPLDGRNGEITVLDSQPLITTIAGNQPVTRSLFAVSAPMLVYAQVPSWTAVGIPAEVQSLEQLDQFVQLQARPDQPLPFRLTGRVAQIKMHVTNRQGRHGGHGDFQVKLELLNREVECLGFWSDHHQGIFTHRGTHIHVHARVSPENLAAHVDEIELQSGRLWLPEDPPKDI